MNKTVGDVIPIYIVKENIAFKKYWFPQFKIWWVGYFNTDFFLHHAAWEQFIEMPAKNILGKCGVWGINKFKAINLGVYFYPKRSRDSGSTRIFCQNGQGTESVTAKILDGQVQNGQILEVSDDMFEDLEEAEDLISLENVDSSPRNWRI